MLMTPSTVFQCPIDVARPLATLLLASSTNVPSPTARNIFGQEPGSSYRLSYHRTNVPRRLATQIVTVIKVLKSSLSTTHLTASAKRLTSRQNGLGILDKDALVISVLCASWKSCKGWIEQGRVGREGVCRGQALFGRGEARNRTLPCCSLQAQSTHNL